MVMRRLFLLLAAGCAGVEIGGQHACAAETQKQLSARLKHEYALVKSMECVYDQFEHPTDPHLIPLVRQLHSTSPHLRALGGVESMIFTKENTAANCFRRHWYRKGTMERGENFATGDDVHSVGPKTAFAFDGQVLRSVNYLEENGKRRAGIKTAQSSQWNLIDRDTPLNFLFQRAEIPYWKIVSEATEFQAEEIQREGATVFAYTLRAPAVSKLKFVLIFEATGRLLERQVYYSILREPEDLRQRFVFTDYRDYSLPSREVVRFPTKIRYSGAPGRLPDGRLVEGLLKSFTVLEARFNVDLPDNLFTLEIPANAETWDGINHAGWIQPGGVLPKPARDRSWLRYLAVGAAVLVAATLLGLVAWRRRRSIA